MSTSQITTEPPSGAETRTRKDPRLLMGYSREGEAQDRRMLLLVGVIVVTFIAFNFLTDGIFFTPRNLSNLAVQMSVTGLVAIGITWLLVARQIDLSSGSLIAIVAVIIGQSEAVLRLPFLVTIVLAVGLGLACGLINGVLVARFGIPAFIATLGAYSYLRGGAYLISDSQTVAGFSPEMFSLGNEGLDPVLSIAIIVVLTGAMLAVKLRQMLATRDRGGFRPSQVVTVVTIALGGGITAWIFGSYRGIPYPVVILAVAIAIAIFVTTQTPFGRHLFAIGGNPASAKRVGLKISRVTLTLFLIAGALAAIGGIIQAARLDSAPPSTATGMELSAISAAVIGGTSLFGGRGSIGGSMLGALLMAAIANGLSLAGVNTFWQLVTVGVLLVIAVATDVRTKKEGAL